MLLKRQPRRSLSTVLHSLLSLLLLHPVEAATQPASAALVKRQYDTGESKIDQDVDVHRREFFTFVTRPDIDAPRWDITIYDQDALAPGYFFVSTYEWVEQKNEDTRAWIGPHIYDSTGELIWSGAPLFRGYNVNDFRVQTVNGEQVLTGVFKHDAIDVMVNSHYDIQNMVVLTKGDINMHDFNVVENGTRALSMNLHRYEASLEESKAVGCDEPYDVLTSGFKEYDTATWEVLFEWNAMDHIPITESYLETKCNNRWDFIHANSIDKFPDGDYLLCGRHTDTLYKISGTTGKIVWRLGGKTSDFEIDGHFSGQHHSRVVSQNSTHVLLSLLDNAIRPGEPHTTNDQSRGMIMALRTDTTPMTAEVLRTYNHPHGDYSPGRGSFQLLPNGNAFAAWWTRSLISEHSADDRVLMEAEWIPELKSYRSFKFPWVGRPTEPPAVHAQVQRLPPLKSGTEKELVTVVHVSWNGATEVATWDLFEAVPLHGQEKHHLRSVERDGFETMVVYDGVLDHVVMEARDRNGTVLGTSEVFKTIPLKAEQKPERSSALARALTNPGAVFIIATISCILTMLGCWITWRCMGRRDLTMRWPRDGISLRWPRWRQQGHPDTREYDALFDSAGTELESDYEDESYELDEGGKGDR
ncbi:uncharacterized protein LTR77_007024 [Saxophila tyrrhenica]|uniref:ASST-domain-containing protein n=1 Tax=Saxophila tyrrhenica TaxID=1690608 RepID=A0AAV9P6W2_9PEZI|nr:hypothetical protein LTR77_007024 [Saxophila tyrrhenica]